MQPPPPLGLGILGPPPLNLRPVPLPLREAETDIPVPAGVFPPVLVNQADNIALIGWRAGEPAHLRLRDVEVEEPPVGVHERFDVRAELAVGEPGRLRPELVAELGPGHGPLSDRAVTLTADSLGRASLGYR